MVVLLRNVTGVLVLCAVVIYIIDDIVDLELLWLSNTKYTR